MPLKPIWSKRKPSIRHPLRVVAAPSEHVLDAGYVDAETILLSRERHDIEVIGPVSQNNQWQAKKGGYDASQFVSDWQALVAVCPKAQNQRQMDSRNRSIWASQYFHSLWPARLSSV